MDRLIEDMDGDTSDFFEDAVELPNDLIIEVLPTSRSRSHYVRVTHFPFTIGRAYDNDLILSDETISAHHLVIGEDNVFSIKDLNSDNGTYCHVLDNKSTKNKKGKIKREKLIEAQSVRLPCTYTLGRTTIRLLSRSSEVIPTKPLDSLSKITELCYDIRVAICLLTVYLLTNIYYALESQSLWMDWDVVVIGQFFELISPLLVATIFSFISYLMTHRWRFSLHLSIACIAFILQQCISEITEFTSYLLTSNNVAYWVGMLLGLFTFLFLFSWQLRALSHLSIRRSHWTSAAIIIPIYMIIFVQSSLLKPDFILQPKMHTVLRANDIRFERSIASVSELAADLEYDLSRGLQQSFEDAQKRNKDNP